MSENHFDQAAPAVEDAKVNVRTLAEGVSNGWEKEQTLTIEQVMVAIQELDVEIAGGSLVVTDKLFSHDGTLLSMDARDAAGDGGVSYMLIGNHGRSRSSATLLERIRYDDDIPMGGDIIAEYIKGAWVKK